MFVNEETEAEMDADKWWAENQNTILLERRDGTILPLGSKQEEEISNKHPKGPDESDESTSDEESKTESINVGKGKENAKIDILVEDVKSMTIDEEEYQ